MQHNEFSTLGWLLQSPNLNPIKHIWVVGEIYMMDAHCWQNSCNCTMLSSQCGQKIEECFKHLAESMLQWNKLILKSISTSDSPLDITVLNTDLYGISTLDSVCNKTFSLPQCIIELLFTTFWGNPIQQGHVLTSLSMLVVSMLVDRHCNDATKKAKDVFLHWKLFTVFW